MGREGVRATKWGPENAGDGENEHGRPGDVSRAGAFAREDELRSDSEEDRHAHGDTRRRARGI